MFFVLILKEKKIKDKMCHKKLQVFFFLNVQRYTCMIYFIETLPMVDLWLCPCTEQDKIEEQYK